MRTKFTKALLLTLACASASWTHFTWVAASGEFQPGKTVKIMVAHGDRFPQSEEAVNAAQVKLFVLAPSGARTDMKPTSTGTGIAADFVVKESGPHRIAFVQDRGAMSRTPTGVRQGDRRKNPGALEAFTMLRTGVWHAGKDHKPVGLDCELSAARDGSTWHVQLLRKGKPLAGQLVQVVLNGQKDAVDLGKTGAEGKVDFKSSTSSGPAMFLAEFKENGPIGGGVDHHRFSTTLYVNW